MTFLDVKKEKIRFTEIEKNPSNLWSIIRDLWTPEIVTRVFLGHEPPDLLSFCFWVVNKQAYLTWVGEECVAVVWLINSRDVSAEINFLANPRKFKLDYQKVGEEFVKVLKKSGKNFNFYGFIADFNRKALNFVLKIGFKTAGLLKDGALNPEDNKLYDLHLVSLQTGRNNESANR